MNNPAFWRSLRSLSHPATIVAVLILLLNDHILRIYWPAWWTGKLGDFSWLVFFPFILTMPLAWLVPARLSRQQAIVFALAVGLTASLFASMKTIPEALDAGLWALRQITGGPFILRLDPTDLLALLGLVVGWWIWTQSEQPAPAYRGWAVLALGALASLATSPPPPLGGVYCLLFDEDERLLGVTDWPNRVFVSENGGLNWNLLFDERNMSNDEFAKKYSCELSSLGQNEIIAQDPQSENISFRITSNIVERTDDGGRTWKTEIDLSLTEAQTSFYYNIKHRSRNFMLAPQDAIFDVSSGNLIVAMGVQGVLVRTPKGTWTRVPVGDYEYVYLNTFDRLKTLLDVEIWMAVALLVLMPLTLRIPLQVSRFEIVMAVISWLTWTGALVFLSGRFINTFLPLGSTLCGMSLAVVLGVWCIGGKDPIVKLLPRQPIVWLISLITPLLFLLPYYFWSQGTIASYILASLFAMGLVVAIVFASGYKQFVDVKANHISNK